MVETSSSPHERCSTAQLSSGNKSGAAEGARSERISIAGSGRDRTNWIATWSVLKTRMLRGAIQAAGLTTIVPSVSPRRRSCNDTVSLLTSSTLSLFW
jgi:hypothetical protein